MGFASSKLLASLVTTIPACRFDMQVSLGIAFGTLNPTSIKDRKVKTLGKLIVMCGLMLLAWGSLSVAKAEAGWGRPARVQSENGIVTLQSRRSIVEIDRYALPPGSPPGAIRVWPPQVRVYRIAQ